MDSFLTSTGHSGADGLLVSARSGSSSAFAELVHPHLRSAMAAATAITGSPHDAEDVMQEALLSAWVQLHQLKVEGAFGAWFRRIVVRAAIRSAKRGRRVHLADLSNRSVPGPEARLVGLALAGAYDRLSPADRAVLYLRVVLGLSVADAAATLGVPTGTIKSRSHYALERLRAAFAEVSNESR